MYGKWRVREMWLVTFLAMWFSSAALGDDKPGLDHRSLKDGIEVKGSGKLTIKATGKMQIEEQRADFSLRGTMTFTDKSSAQE